MNKQEKDFYRYAADRHISSSTLNGYKGYLTPTIIEESDKLGSMVTIDIFSRLMKDRTLYLGCEVNADVANILICQLLYLDNAEPGKPINLYINSPGGSCSDGLGIVDAMNFISSPVNTLTTAIAASMGSIIFVSGEKRYMLPNSKLLLHEVRQTGSGIITLSDAQDELKEMEHITNTLYNILSNRSNKSLEEIREICKRDRWVYAPEALEWGMCDEIIVKNANFNEKDGKK